MVMQRGLAGLGRVLRPEEPVGAGWKGEWSLLWGPLAGDEAPSHKLQGSDGVRARGF